MAQRPGLEPDEADEHRAEGDEGRQPATRAGNRQGGDDEGVGGEQEADQDRPYRRPAGRAAQLPGGSTTGVAGGAPFSSSVAR